jgi:hypothetical protein
MIKLLKIIVLLTMVYQKKNTKTSILIPDEKTAIKIAEAVWLPIYGDNIYKRIPFVANLKNDSVWIIKGTLNIDTSNIKKNIIFVRSGGVPYLEINKFNCKVIKVSHGK